MSTPGGCIFQISGGGVYLPYIPILLKGPGIRHTHHPCVQNDTRLWKHYLTTTSLAGGNNPLSKRKKSEMCFIISNYYLNYKILPAYRNVYWIGKCGLTRVNWSIFRSRRVLVQQIQRVMWLCMVHGHWSSLLYNRYTVFDDWSVSLVARRTQVIWKDKSFPNGWSFFSKE